MARERSLGQEGDTGECRHLAGGINMANGFFGLCFTGPRLEARKLR